METRTYAQIMKAAIAEEKMKIGGKEKMKIGGKEKMKIGGKEKMEEEVEEEEQINGPRDGYVEEIGSYDAVLKKFRATYRKIE